MKRCVSVVSRLKPTWLRKLGRHKARVVTPVEAADAAVEVVSRTEQRQQRLRSFWSQRSVLSTDSFTPAPVAHLIASLGGFEEGVVRVLDPGAVLAQHRSGDVGMPEPAVE
jgi:hypothetical protein